MLVSEQIRFMFENRVPLDFLRGRVSDSVWVILKLLYERQCDGKK